MHGKGIAIVPGNQVIVTYWMHNIMHGPFTWFFDDGFKIEGTTDHGEQVGLQIHTEPDGTKRKTNLESVCETVYDEV